MVEKIYQHIEKLLAYHDYVVVPGLGGFVVQQQFASIYDNFIFPPSAGVAFNPLMNHSDGLLAIEVARAEGVTYRMATEIIEEELSKFKKLLENNESCRFGSLGILSLVDGAVVFTPEKLAEFLPDNLSLSQIKLSDLSKSNSKTAKTVSFVLPGAQTFKYAASVALLLGMLFFSQQVNDVKNSSEASVISIKAFDSVAVAEESPKVVVNCPELVETTLPDGLVQNNDSDLYHVVVASLPTRQSADEYCQMLKEQDFECAHVLEPVKSYRVSVKSFADRSEAIAYMENLRKTDSRFETAWVLCK